MKSDTPRPDLQLTSPEMHRAFGDARIEVVVGNIVDQRVDAIVNAANTELRGGGGVDGAIHAAAGPSVLEACLAIQPNKKGERCPTGEARVTHAGKLDARVIVHTVGPIFSEARAEECDVFLIRAYRSSLEAARENACVSVAFPAISTGVYRFPKERAAPIALRTTYGFLRDDPGSVRLVRFVLFNERDVEPYAAPLAQLPNGV